MAVNVVVRMDDGKELVIKDADTYGVCTNADFAYIKKDGNQLFFPFNHLMYIGDESKFTTE